MKTIPAQIIKVNDLEARRISAAENLQHEDLSAVEEIEAIVEIVDAELNGDKEYASMGKKPANRVRNLFRLLDSERRSQSRGSAVFGSSKALSNTYIGQVDKIFTNLPKSLKWQSFCLNDLPILMEIFEKVKKIAIENGLSRAQARALQELRNASSEEFQLVTNGCQNAPNDGKGPGSKVAAKIGLNDLSGREIGTMAEKEAKKAKRDKLNRPRVSPSSRPEIVAMTMRRLGIPAWRTAAMLGIDHNTLKKVSENSKANARIAFLIADWRDFQGMAAMEEDPDQSILLSDYMDIMRRSGWKVTHLIDCPLSTERFRPHMVKRMQNNKTLGVVRRSLIIGRRD